jgi:hypothetical protein
MFAQRLGEGERSYMTRREFLTRFWAAYTYEDADEAEDKGQQQPEAGDGVGRMTAPAIMASVSHNVVAANRKIRSELDQKARRIKMFRSIQKQIRAKLPVQAAFMQMDNQDHGFLSLRDFHMSFARLFDLAIKNDEIRALFNEVDADGDGIVRFAEFEGFYKQNYVKRLADVEQERQMKNT